MKKSLMVSLLFLASPLAYAEDPNILWNIVHGQCVPAYNSSEQYTPCTLVDGQERSVVYKVDGDLYQYLILPTDKITGIEDPLLLSDATKPYFYQAWRSRELVSAKLNGHIREQDMALAVNAINSRSQNQLHIHLSCLSPKVRAVLDTIDMRQFDHKWQPLGKPLGGNNYSAIKLTSSELSKVNVFKLVHERVRQQGKEMQYSTIGLVNLDKDNLLLLTASGSASSPVGAETDLLDHTCALSQRNSGRLPLVTDAKG
jgi:CDP-diacylglycerol pyrophosphatase